MQHPLRTALNTLLVSATLLGNAFAAIREEAVSYQDGGTTMKGYIVYDDAITTKRPGVVVVHEWWGITKHVRDEARNFASQGFTALVADMYGEGRTADNPKDAGALAGSVRGYPALMQSRFNAAKDTLAKHASVNAASIGAAGYCFGGSVVLDMARVGTDLKAVAAFHADLNPASVRATPGKVKAKLLVLNGEADPFIKPESIVSFKSEMTGAAVDYKYLSYPGAVHAFTNPEATALGQKFNIPVAYQAEADQRSKAETAQFFSAELRK